MEVADTSETLLRIYHVTRLDISDDHNVSSVPLPLKVLLYR